MAKNPGGGPGTYVKGGVRCTVDAPFSKGSNKGSGNSMGAPFGAARSGGDNGLPTKIYDSVGGAGKAPSPSGTSSLGTIKTSRE